MSSTPAFPAEVLGHKGGTSGELDLKTRPGTLSLVRTGGANGKLEKAGHGVSLENALAHRDCDFPCFSRGERIKKTSISHQSLRDGLHKRARPAVRWCSCSVTPGRTYGHRALAGIAHDGRARKSRRGAAVLGGQLYLRSQAGREEAGFPWTE